MTAMNTLIVALSCQISGTRTIEELDELGLAFAALSGTGLVSPDRMSDVGSQLQARRQYVERINAPPVISADTRYAVLTPRVVGVGWDFHTREGLTWDEARKERDHLHTTGRTAAKIILIAGQ